MTTEAEVVIADSTTEPIKEMLAGMSHDEKIRAYIIAKTMTSEDPEGDVAELLLLSAAE